MDTRGFLSSPKYFANIIEEAAARGIVHIHTWTGDSKEFPLALPNYARLTRLFFEVQDKAILLMCSLAEMMGGDKLSQCWRIYIETEIKRNSAFADTVVSHDSVWTCDCFNRDSGYVDWSASGGSSVQIGKNFAQRPVLVTISPAMLVESLTQIAGHVLFCAVPRFATLGIWEFPAEHFFPASVSSFWQQFPLEKIKAKVEGEVWTINGHKKVVLA